MKPAQVRSLSWKPAIADMIVEALHYNANVFDIMP